MRKPHAKHQSMRGDSSNKIKDPVQSLVGQLILMMSYFLTACIVPKSSEGKLDTLEIKFFFSWIHFSAADPEPKQDKPELTTPPKDKFVNLFTNTGTYSILVDWLQHYRSMLGDIYFVVYWFNGTFLRKKKKK